MGQKNIPSFTDLKKQDSKKVNGLPHAQVVIWYFESHFNVVSNLPEKSLRSK